MGKLSVEMFMTLDGVIQAPGGPDEDRESGFPYGGWQAPYGDEDSGRAIVEHLLRLDALLLGRRTYDIFANYWPQQSGVIAEKLNSVPKYIASTTLERLEWGNSTLLDGDVPAAVRRITEQHDEVHTIGSAGLVQTLFSTSWWMS
jgi:dihydrofolate reductase